MKWVKIAWSGLDPTVGSWFMVPPGSFKSSFCENAGIRQNNEQAKRPQTQGTWGSGHTWKSLASPNSWKPDVKNRQIPNQLIGKSTANTATCSLCSLRTGKRWTTMAFGHCYRDQAGGIPAGSDTLACCSRSPKAWGRDHQKAEPNWILCAHNWIKAAVPD